MIDELIPFSIYIWLYPERLRGEIDTLNRFIYEHINDGVYRAGFTTSQRIYEQATSRPFKALDCLETRLATCRSLLGPAFVETDWHLFGTLIRLDAVYHGHFTCNLRRIVDLPKSLWVSQGPLSNKPNKPTASLRRSTSTISSIRRHAPYSHQSLPHCAPWSHSRPHVTPPGENNWYNLFSSPFFLTIPLSNRLDDSADFFPIDRLLVRISSCRLFVFCEKPLTLIWISSMRVAGALFKGAC
ncbi:MAG: hypothetical protein NNA25_06780 [Nitrospira sp.]|nr:hypothetical protein [Nitrospira sp.]